MCTICFTLSLLSPPASSLVEKSINNVGEFHYDRNLKILFTNYRVFSDKSPFVYHFSKSSICCIGIFVSIYILQGKMPHDFLTKFRNAGHSEFTRLDFLKPGSSFKKMLGIHKLPLSQKKTKMAPLIQALCNCINYSCVNKSIL